jgi:hypothetical protein
MAIAMEYILVGSIGGCLFVEGHVYGLDQGQHEGWINIW